MEEERNYLRDEWDRKFLKMTSHVSEWSKDKNTKVGAVIVDEDRTILSIGYNGFPRGCNDNIEERYEKPLKYKYTEHAERNAIYNAARVGTQLKNSIIYIPFLPCVDCCRGIIQAGIKEVVTLKTDLNHKTWGQDFQISLQLLEEVNVNVIYYNFNIEDL